MVSSQSSMFQKFFTLIHPSSKTPRSFLYLLLNVGVFFLQISFCSTRRYPPSLLNSGDYVSQLIGGEQKVSQLLVDKLVQKSV